MEVHIDTCAPTRGKPTSSKRGNDNDILKRALELEGGGVEVFTFRKAVGTTANCQQDTGFTAWRPRNASVFTEKRDLEKGN